MQYFKLITESNKFSLNKPHDSDIVYYSELKEWFTTEAFRSFSIKCVLEEIIHYKIGTTEYAVTPDHFLLSSKQPDVKAYFESSKMVKSICIDICPVTVSEVFTLLSEKKDPQFENYMASYFRHPDFLESVYCMDDSLIGKKLKELASRVRNNREQVVLNKEWFYELMEYIVYQEYGNYVTLSNIHKLKSSTRKETYRRLKIAMDYINENFLHITNIKEIARACALSEYHFYRSFKQVYRVSPHQFILRKRLSTARDLMNQKNISITQVASACGFPDIFSFSKAFKKHFLQTPSSYKKQLLSKTSDSQFSRSIN